MSADLLSQLLLNAAIMGALYGLLGLSFGLIYSTSKILHFAHGGIYIAAAYLFLTLYVRLDWALVPAVLATVAGAGLFGIAVMAALYRPLLLRKTSSAVIMIASLGLFIVIENVVILLFGNLARVVTKGGFIPAIPLGPVYITPLQIYMLATASAVFFALYLLITKSRVGRALRAIADDADTARIIGIDVQGLYYLVFALGSMTLAVPAILNGMDVGIFPGMGLHIVLIAAVAVIIGGASSIFAGIAGGFLVAALQSLMVLWFDPRWQNFVVFSALILVLVFRPTGLFASKR